MPIRLGGMARLRPENVRRHHQRLRLDVATRYQVLLRDNEIKVSDDAVLFLWGTIPLLPQALEVMKEWDFQYKHAIAWDKRAGCVGEYFDGRWEILFVGYRVSFRPRRSQTFQTFTRYRESPTALSP